MKCFLLQDWVRISSANTNAIAQPEANWLDLSSYRDIVAWLDVKQNTIANIAYQTAVAKDDLLFTNMTTFAPSVGVTTTTLLQDVQAATTGALPLARWFRWSLFGFIGPYDMTFRIWIAANKPGRRNGRT